MAAFVVPFYGDSGRKYFWWFITIVALSLIGSPASLHRHAQYRVPVFVQPSGVLLLSAFLIFRFPSAAVVFDVVCCVWRILSDGFNMLWLDEPGE